MFFKLEIHIEKQHAPAKLNNFVCNVEVHALFPIFGHVILLVPFALACFVNVLSAFSFEIAFRP